MFQYAVTIDNSLRCKQVIESLFQITYCTTSHLIRIKYSVCALLRIFKRKPLFYLLLSSFLF